LGNDGELLSTVDRNFMSGKELGLAGRQGFELGGKRFP
jgi:hypothetical protein